MLLDDCRSRIAGRIPELPAARLQFAAELAELVRRDALPNAPLSAYLLESGSTPTSPGQSGAGYFIQPIEQRVTLVLIMNSAGDVTGGNAVVRADDMPDRCIRAMVGWAPAGDADHAYTTDFRFAGSAPPALSAGRVMTQLDFVIGLQLRILA